MWQRVYELVTAVTVQIAAVMYEWRESEGSCFELKNFRWRWNYLVRLLQHTHTNIPFLSHASVLHMECCLSQLQIVLHAVLNL